MLFRPVIGPGPILPFMLKHDLVTQTVLFLKLLAFFSCDFLKTGTSSVDRHRFDAEPDPNRNLHFDVDPDPDSDLDLHHNDADFHADPSPCFTHVGFLLLLSLQLRLFTTFSISHQRQMCHDFKGAQV
jgi:hypothetical protein